MNTRWASIANFQFRITNRAFLLIFVCGWWFGLWSIIPTFRFYYASASLTDIVAMGLMTVPGPVTTATIENGRGDQQQQRLRGHRGSELRPVRRLLWQHELTHCVSLWQCGEVGHDMMMTCDLSTQEAALAKRNWDQAFQETWINQESELIYALP